MTVTEEINNYIRDVGKGSMRDALNIALATIQRLKAENIHLLTTIKELAQDMLDAPEGYVHEGVGDIVRVIDAHISNQED